MERSACWIVTNLFGGWIASRSGVKVTLFGGLLQIFSLLMLATSVAFVTTAQALSGIAKDLTKMSSKSAIKVVVPGGANGALFQWVARLTGSKNALKDLGFFVGGALLAGFGIRGTLIGMAGALLVLLSTAAFLSDDLGRSKKRVRMSSLLSKSAEIGLPVFLSQMGWSSYSVGAFLACWVIGYGIVQEGCRKY